MFPPLDATGMSAGLPKHVTVNLSVIADAIRKEKLSADSEVTLEALKSAGHRGNAWAAQWGDRGHRGALRGVLPDLTAHG